MIKQYPLTALEVASGYVFGHDPQTPHLPSDGEPHPLRAFEHAIRQALLKPPCGVAFSGGRDSSAVLAVAVDVARREGFDLPVPVTLRFPESAESEETEWQEGVLRHLGLDEWVRLEVTSEFDCVGPIATACLGRHGLLWPANAHVLVPLLEAVAGGSLLTGDGGDLAFEPANWAVRPLSVLAGRVRPMPRDLLRVGFALSPPPVRLAVLRRRQPQPLPCPWLQPAALRAVDEAWRADSAREPLNLRRKVVWGWRLRPVQMALATFEVLAADADTKLVHPFNTPTFLAALSGAARSLRLADRTGAMRWLFADLLPDAVCARPTKAGFRDVFWNRHSRAFAETWEGESADPELVRIDVLRDLWRSGTAREHFRSATQLQAAWLTRERRPNRSAGDRVEQTLGRLGK